MSRVVLLAVLWLLSSAALAQGTANPSTLFGTSPGSSGATSTAVPGVTGPATPLSRTTGRRATGGPSLANEPANPPAAVTGAYGAEPVGTSTLYGTPSTAAVPDTATSGSTSTVPAPAMQAGDTVTVPNASNAVPNTASGVTPNAVTAPASPAPVR